MIHYMIKPTSLYMIYINDKLWFKIKWSDMVIIYQQQCSFSILRHFKKQKKKISITLYCTTWKMFEIDHYFIKHVKGLFLQCWNIDFHCNIGHKCARWKVTAYIVTPMTVTIIIKIFIVLFHFISNLQLYNL
jgi:hypothetical protein